MKDLVLVPRPQVFRTCPGAYDCPSDLSVGLPAAYSPLFQALRTLWPELHRTEGAASITIETEAALSPEAYRLCIRDTGITVSCAAPAGAFYGLMTLRQIVRQSGSRLACCEIEDRPGLSIRGVMLDISRGKVPALETLKSLADGLASFKINHLELYIEGFSFAYPSFRELWEKDRTPLTSEEIRELDLYCRARFIDLVPAQNGLGHMADWLNTEEYRHLAELEDGKDASGKEMQPTTLDAADPGSLQLVSRMTDDLMPCFSSPYFNACLDEPFELGLGKNKARADREGADSIYLEYVEQVYQLLSQRGKTMMMWGDIVGKEGLSAELPKDLIVLDWGYEAEYPVEERASALEKAGLRFCVCPGTNSWLNFSGLTDNMSECVRRAADAAYRHGAMGMIVTDWGDLGHLQYLPYSWPGFLLSAALSWNREGAEESCLAAAMDLFLFQDRSRTLGSFFWAAGRYGRLDEFRLPCRTLVYLPMVLGIISKEKYEDLLGKIVEFLCGFCPDPVAEIFRNSYRDRKPFDPAAILCYLDGLCGMLKKASPQCADADLLLREAHNALCFVRICTRARAVICELDDGAGLSEEIDAAASEHRELWLSRNKPAGLEEGLAPFYRLKSDLQARQE